MIYMTGESTGGGLHSDMSGVNSNTYSFPSPPWWRGPQPLGSLLSGAPFGKCEHLPVRVAISMESKTLSEGSGYIHHPALLTTGDSLLGTSPPDGDQSN